MTVTYRYAVLRVPGSGPKALIAPPNDFATLAEAEARVAAIEVTQRKVHHTHLEVFRYSGSLTDALRDAGIIY